jgi:murein DD-endopeptidase MepM/ murein hydrolase activator NlpD
VAKVPLQIVDGNYHEEKLKVSPKHVAPKKKDLIRIEKEQKEIGLLYKKIREEREWKGPFGFPIQSIVTSPYGGKRLFNGQLQSSHQGLDLRAKMRTPILAPTGGTVVLAKELFFTGNTVILDHGYGLFTIYAHMSKLKVKRGDVVTTGKLLGLSGMTGRASGPHLHWGAVLRAVKLDPLDLTRVID